MIARDGRQAGIPRLSHRRLQRAAAGHVRGAQLGRACRLRPPRRRQSRLLGARRRPRARLPADARHQQALSAHGGDRSRSTRRAQEWNHAHPARARPARSPTIAASYDALAERCRSIIDLQMHNAAEPPDGLEQQADSLGRLSWMFLRLLLARRTIGQVLGGAQNDVELQRQHRRARAAAGAARAERGAARAASAASSRSCASACSSAPTATASSPTSTPSSSASSSRSS